MLILAIDRPSEQWHNCHEAASLGDRALALPGDARNRGNLHDNTGYCPGMELACGGGMTQLVNPI